MVERCVILGLFLLLAWAGIIALTASVDKRSQEMVCISLAACDLNCESCILALWTGQKAYVLQYPRFPYQGQNIIVIELVGMFAPLFSLLSFVKVVSSPEAKSSRS